jgi:hypothetical protein
MPAAAHFQVIHMASALTSLRVTPGWYTRKVVLDAVPLEHSDRPVVHLHREVDDQLALGLPQEGADPRLEAEKIRRRIELPLCIEPGVLDRFCRHRKH